MPGCTIDFRGGHGTASGTPILVWTAQTIRFWNTTPAAQAETNNARIVAKGDFEWGFQWSITRSISMVGRGVSVATPHAQNDGNRHHIMGTVDSSYLCSLHVDNTLSDTMTEPAPPDNLGLLAFGEQVGGGFHGLQEVADFLLYNRVLRGGELSALYALGVPPSSGWTARYTFSEDRPMNHILRPQRRDETLCDHLGPGRRQPDHEVHPAGTSPGDAGWCSDCARIARSIVADRARAAVRMAALAARHRPPGGQG